MAQVAHADAVAGTHDAAPRILVGMRRLRSLAIVVGAVLVIAAVVIGLIGLNDYLTCGDPPHYGCGPGRHSPSGSYTDCVPC